LTKVKKLLELEDEVMFYVVLVLYRFLYLQIVFSCSSQILGLRYLTSKSPHRSLRCAKTAVLSPRHTILREQRTFCVRANLFTIREDPMGLLDKIFGGQKNEYPPLEMSSPAGRTVEQVKGALEKLTKQINDPMEVVTGSDKTFVFVGKPPRQFGMLWIQGGEIHNFAKHAKEKNISQIQFQSLSEQLREAYQRNQSAERFSAKVADKTITVMTSDSLGTEVNRIVENLSG
jgi:hypothetical protein